MRLSGVVNLERPFLGTTSGIEEEALLSIWKAQRGDPIYTDALAPPFSTSFFNWLFYWAYALWGKLWRAAWSGDEAWLPTVWRALSLLFCAGTGWLLWRMLARNARAPDRAVLWLAPCLAGVCVFNPLFQWMSISARPDMGAVFFEMLGFALLIASLRRPSTRLVLLAGAAAAVAWGFKQSQVFLFAGGAIFLAWHRRWRDLAVFAMPLIAGAAAAFLLSDPWYRQNTLTLHVFASGFDPAQGVKLALAAALKAPLMPAGLLTLALLAPSWKELGPEPRLAAIATAAGFLLCLATSSKLGAADYYYLTPSVFASALLFLSLPELSRTAAPAAGAATAAAACGLLAQIAVVGLILAGKLGRVNIRNDEAPALALRPLLARETGPAFVTGRNFNLPWINPSRPSFVYSSLYDQYERSFPDRLREGGIRSMVARAEFPVVVDTAGAAIDLSRELADAYALDGTVDGFRVYRARRR